ncbi:S8 family peptidase [Paenibacillus sp. MBLB4367]|uniref:S8 family peptidase n=1 Tax=Paenibacillus sp. MBLB4367 TaxID=3384767 RepID=UPI0039082574
MNQLAALLKSIVSDDQKVHIASNSSRTRVRRLIVLKNNACYTAFLRAMKSAGLTPDKKIKSHRAVLCHVNPSTNLQALSNHALVKRIELDRKLAVHVLPDDRAGSSNAACASVNRNQTIPWGISRIRAPRYWDRASYGRNVKVGVIDTGVSSHPDLNISGSYNAINSSRSARDDNGHGTHVAGTLAGLNNTFGVIGAASSVRLYAVKAFDASGAGFVSDIIEGIDWCIRKRMHIINMSFGMPEGSATLLESIQRAYRKGIVLVASGGNNGIMADQLDYPAKYSETIAVAATTRDNQIASFSSRGKGITIAAPGVGICSTIPGSKYSLLSGTSMATPHVSGAAALLLNLYPGITPSQLKSKLKQNARRLSGYSSSAQGAGLLQL